MYLNQSPVLSAAINALLESEEIESHVEQVELQAEYGRKCIQYAKLKLNGSPAEVPLPTWITTEDGWDFLLRNRNSNLLVAADGCNVGLHQVLDLISQSPIERENDPFPSFTVREWDFEQTKLNQAGYEL